MIYQDEGIDFRFFWRTSVPLSVLSDEESEPLRSGLGNKSRLFLAPHQEQAFGINLTGTGIPI